jgi:hypothetical protein
MNTTPDKEADALRSEINQTRRRMDDTMDELGERFQGRHLIDEVLGFFRRQPGRAREVGETLSRSASSTARAVTDTVKAHPVPLLLIGAGVAWMIYERTRRSSYDDYESDYEEPRDEPASQRDWADTDTLYDRPLDYPSSATVQNSTTEPGASSGSSDSKLGRVKDRVVEKAAQTREQMRERFADVGSRVREKTGEISARARETYERGRDRVVTTADEHPLELGLACLAAGVIAGLAVPTARPLNRLAGPSMDRLRERTRDAGSELMHKTQRVASAAVGAAKREAQTQGLTPEGMAQPQDSAGNNAPRENQSGSVNPTSSQPKADPLASRPVM